MRIEYTYIRQQAISDHDAFRPCSTTQRVSAVDKTNKYIKEIQTNISDNVDPRRTSGNTRCRSLLRNIQSATKNLTLLRLNKGREKPFDHKLNLLVRILFARLSANETLEQVRKVSQWLTTLCFFVVCARD